MDNHIIAVEGTLGTNKSLLMYEINKRLSSNDYFVSTDPYEHFSCYKNKYNPLKLMYNLPYEYSGFTQVHINKVLFDYFKNINEGHLLCGKKTLSKRSIYSSHVFNETNFQMGFYNEFVYDSISDQINEIIKDLNFDEMAPHKTIFVDCKLETTVERIVFRNRAEEHKLRYMTAYLEELREQYLSFLTFLRESDKRVLYLKHEVAVTPSELDTIVRFIETV